MSRRQLLSLRVCFHGTAEGKGTVLPTGIHRDPCLGGLIHWIHASFLKTLTAT